MSLRAIASGLGEIIPPAPTAGEVSYDNTASGLTATNVQSAIDEVEEDTQNKIPINATLTTSQYSWSLYDPGSNSPIWQIKGTDTAKSWSGELQISNYNIAASVVDPASASSLFSLMANGIGLSVTPISTNIPTTFGLYGITDTIAINATHMSVNNDSSNIRYTVSDPNDITHKAYVDGAIVSALEKPTLPIVYVSSSGVDDAQRGSIYAPLKTMAFAESLLSVGGIIHVLGSITDSYTQTKDNIDIRGDGTQWSPASFITGNITQPSGRQRLAVYNIGITGTITIQGNGNNYFQNLNGGNVVFSGASNGYNEFWQCEASTKTITAHNGTIASNLCRNLSVTQTSATAVYAAQMCQGGSITMQTAGTVFLSRCNSINATHHAGALLIDRCGGLALSSDANVSATSVIKIFASDFFDPTSTTYPAGYFVCQKTGTCFLATDAITKYPENFVPSGTITVVSPNTPTPS